MRGGSVVEKFSVDEAGGEPLFVATTAGAAFVRDGALLRAPSGTRAGQVLSARTRLFAGGDLGFGVWEAGRVAMPFVFDLARGPLAHSALPAPAGRVVDASCVMEGGAGGHILFTREIDASGRVACEHFLLDRAGALVASRAEPADDPVFGAGIHRCLAEGRVLAATSPPVIAWLERAIQRVRSARSSADRRAQL